MFVSQYGRTAVAEYCKINQIKSIKSAKSVCNLGALQDGEHSSHLVGNIIQNGDWMIKMDLKDAYFFISIHQEHLHPNPSRASSLVTLLVAGTSVRIPMPPLWTILSPKSAHQSDTPHSGMAETAGNKNGGIHRRLPSVGTLQGGSSPPSPVNDNNVPSSGIFHQHREISPDPMSGNRVSGCYDSITPTSPTPATAQTAGTQVQSFTASMQRHLQTEHHSQGDCSVYWDSECCSSSNSTSSSILQIPSSHQTLFSKLGGGAEQYSSAIPYRQRGAKLVDAASQAMESSQPTATSQLAKDNYRCIQPGLGSSLQGGDHWRTLVTDRGLLPHKLPGDASSIPSSSVFHKGLSSSPQSISTWTTRQQSPTWTAKEGRSPPHSAC